jgi:hypothetical protein
VTYTHGSILDGATEIAEQFDLAKGDRVVLAADATEPGTLVAGVLAPLSAGATIHVPATSDAQASTSANAAFVVTDGEDSGERFVSATEVTRSLRDTRRA